MILLIDNYDSFTHNLAQLIGLEQEVVIVRNDDPRILQLSEQAAALVISPGPGTPKETGYVKEIIQRFYQTKPLLGICLGHQAIGEVFGAQVIAATEIRHGKQSMVTLSGDSLLFKELESEIAVMRYHSLVIAQQKIPQDFTITAISAEDQEVMAMEHQRYPVFGLQFHPESIGTPDGAKMIQNFIQLTEVYSNERAF